jgi:hypothetical protein
MAQQTAMQELWAWIDANCHEETFNISNAREMSLRLEKEQIIDAYDKNKMGRVDYGEQYYNETYNK